MIFLRACLAATWLKLASLKGRIGSALVVVAGVACVVGVLLSMLSVTVGLRQAWERAGSPDRAIILPADGSVTLQSSGLIPAVTFCLLPSAFTGKRPSAKTK